MRKASCDVYLCLKDRLLHEDICKKTAPGIISSNIG